MGAFQSGFQMGQRAWQQALDNKDREEQRKREADEYGLRRQQLVMQNQAMEDAAAQRRELAGLRTELGDYQQGFNRQGFNTAANNDFDAALAASDNAVRAENVARKGGMPAPVAAYAPPTQGNLAAEQGMRTQFTQAPDITSDGFQRGMSGLQQRYALAAGDMKGFGDLQAAERQRRTNAEDAAYSMRVIQNPEGPEAIEARSFVNNSSRSLSVDTDPKTGISTFRIIKGDRTKPIDVGPSDMSKIAVGVRRLQRGDVGGLDVIAAVNKDLAAAVREEFKLDVEVGKSNNEATYKIGSLNNQTEGLKIQREGVGLQRQRLNMDRMGMAQYREGEDGNTYALIPTMTKNGLAFNTVKVNPPNVALKPTGKPGADVELKPGSIYQTPGGVRYTVADNGEKLVDGAPQPRERTNLLLRLGFSKPDAEQMEWASGGRHVKWGAEGYDVTNPNEMRELLRAVTEYKTTGQAMAELEAQGGGARRGLRAQPSFYREQRPLSGNAVDYQLFAPQ